MTPTCYGVHSLSGVVGALRGALAARKPPCGAAGEVHVGPPCSWTPQSTAGVEHPPHVSNPAGLVVKLGVKESMEQEGTTFSSQRYVFGFQSSEGSFLTLEPVRTSIKSLNLWFLKHSCVWKPSQPELSAKLASKTTPDTGVTDGCVKSSISQLLFRHETTGKIKTDQRNNQHTVNAADRK